MIAAVLEPQIFIYNIAAEREESDVLSDGERSRAARFRFEHDRRRFVIAHAKLRQALAKCTGADAAALQFGVAANGKPFAHDHAIEFSLSHSAEIVVIAVSSAPVGVDVERIEARPGLEQVAAEFFDDAELCWLREQTDRTGAFYRLWTMKEAALKADGQGIATELKHASVDTQQFDRVVVRGKTWHVTPVDAGPGYAAALARE